MFTGIIESLAKVKDIKKDKGNLQITFMSSIAKELKVDQSVCHNGACLTVVQIDGDQYLTDAIAETIARTNLGDLKIGDNVLIGSNNLISHNTVIENNCFLTSNITLGGHITIGTNSFVGLSATINQRVKIGKECIIGAGTLITKDVKDKEVYAENSSKKLPQSSSEIVDIM